MSRSLVIKIGAIVFLIALLLIPLIRINVIITERQQRRDEVVRDIARSSSYSQVLTGPVIVVPYHKTERLWQEDSRTKQRTVEEHDVAGQLYFLPETFKLDGQLQTEERVRGIYVARLYHADNKMSGGFSIPAQYGISENFNDYRFEPAFIALGISDIRGIENALTVRIGEQDLAFQPGTDSKILGTGVRAILPMLDGKQGASFAFHIDLKLQGTGDIQITPVGRATQIELSANWPHPSFVGEYLPIEHSIDAKGFHARWNTTFFSTNLAEALNSCVQSANCGEFNNRRFGVSLIDPVDQYLKSDRAAKYALLFIVLTFAGFFLFEVLKRLAVHPIQYGLVGTSLALFYLLLLSLSEHIGFALAYVISATACVSLIGFYVVHVLQSVARGLGFASTLGALYALLYVLLNAEDYALLMGSILVFGLLGAVMVLTRKIDWFALTNKQAG